MIDINYTNITRDFWDWSLQGYNIGVGIEFYFYPLIFSAILGYLYIKTESAVVLGVASILLVGGYAASGVFDRVGPFVTLLQVITTLALVGLIVLFVTRWRK